VLLSSCFRAAGELVVACCSARLTGKFLGKVMRLDVSPAAFRLSEGLQRWDSTSGVNAWCVVDTPRLFQACRHTSFACQAGLAAPIWSSRPLAVPWVCRRPGSRTHTYLIHGNMATQEGRLRTISYLFSEYYFAHSTPVWREGYSTVDSGRLSAALRTQPAKMLFHLEILFSLPSGPLRLHPVSFHSGRVLQVLLRWMISAVVAMALVWVRLGAWLR
jgi:hypothetical protein